HIHQRPSSSVLASWGQAAHSGGSVTVLGRGGELHSFGSGWATTSAAVQLNDHVSSICQSTAAGACSYGRRATWATTWSWSSRTGVSCWPGSPPERATRAGAGGTPPTTTSWPGRRTQEALPRAHPTPHTQSSSS